MFSKSSGTPETGAWVYIAWLLWLAAVMWVVFQTTQAEMDGLRSYVLTQSLACTAGLLSAPLLERVRVANLMILVPVWLFGAWYSVLNLKMPEVWLLLPLCAYVLGMIVGAVILLLITRLARRRSKPPA
ncbi:MAG: hypothetical protein ACK4RG_06910 [Fimbriimonadales bacterium]